MGRLRFEELGKAKYREGRALVISRAYSNRDGVFEGYAVTQQLIENEGKENETRVFLKNGIGVVSPESLVMLADLMAEICHDEGLLTISDASDDEAEEV